MRIKKKISILKNAHLKLFSVLGVSFLAGLLAFSGIRTFANTQVGNFANNVRTELSVLDRKDGAEKVDYLSGETINMSARVEVTAEGGIQSYDNAYALIKVPKQYLNGTPDFSVTSAVNSSSVVSDPDFYIFKANYKSLKAGSINSINFGFKLKDPQTPAGYKPEVTLELYDSQNNVLSRQKKQVNTIKNEVELYSPGKNASQYQPYIARYTDATNTVIDRASIDQMGNLSYSIYGYSRVVGSSQFGKIKLNKITLTDTLPEHTTLSQESKDAGWTYDEATRVATFVKNIGENDSTTSISQPIKLKVLDTFPDTAFNKPLVNNASMKFEFDGTTLTKDVSATVTPRVLPIVSGNLVSASKYDNYSSYAGMKTLNNKRSSSADTNIKADGTVSNLYYHISTTIANSGTDQPVRIDEIVDHIKDDKVRLRRVYISYDSIPAGKSPEGSELYVTNSAGVETKVKDVSKNGEGIDLPEDTVKISLKLPADYKFPAHKDNAASYSPVYFSVFYKVLDRQAFLDNIPKDGTSYYDVVNDAIVKTPEGEIVKTASMRHHREGVEVTNEITPSSSAPVSRVGDISFNQKVTKIGTSYNYSSDIANVTNKQLTYLFPKELELGSVAKKCIADGKCKFIEDYKNTGKKALVIDNVENNDMRSSLSNFLRVEETTPNGEYQVELITTWNEDDLNYGRASDDLDFRNDGSTTSRNVARSTATFTVLKPEQVAIRKYVNNPRTVSGYGQDISDYRPTDLIDWRISVINISDRPLHSSRVLEVLPYENDKRIVAGNDGSVENRGTTAGSKLVGPIPAQNGFTITYSTDAPGANETESWAKNFVPGAQITDWSQVRMIKIVQNAGYVVQPQTVINFQLQSKIDENAPDNTIINNSTAVSISNTGGLVESDIVTARIQHDAVVRGIAFEDKNNNDAFDQDTDTLLSGYKVKFYDGTTLLGETETAQDGSYSFTTRKFNRTMTVRFEKKNDNKRLVTQANDNTLENKKSNIASTDTNTNPNEFVSYSFSFSNNRKLVIRNLGVTEPFTTLKVRYLNTSGKTIKEEVVVKDREAFNPDSPTPYDVTSLKDREITAKDGLVYTFQKKKDNDPADAGNLVEGETVITYIYEPKNGGNVKAKFVIGDTDEELKGEQNVYLSSRQIGSSYDAETKLSAEFIKDDIEVEYDDGSGNVAVIPSYRIEYSGRPTELTKNNLVYTYRSVRTSGAPAVGKVKEEEQTVIFEYIPKAGSSVKVQFYNEQGTQIKPEATIFAEGTQIGKEYSSAPPTEITHQGITYVYKVLKDDSDPQAGRVKETPQIVKYVYTPKKGGQVIANYVNQEGQTIANTKVVKATDTPVGTAYSDTPPAEITTNDGLVYVYELLKSGNQNGNVKAETQEIVYQYKKKEGGEVKAKFVDEKGNKLKDEAIVAASGTQVGSNYTATKDNEITKDGLVYIFKKHDEASASETGKVVVGTQTVVYVYSPKLGGEVDAKFVDEKGNELKDGEIVKEQNTQVGTDYEAKNPTEITKDGLVYIYKTLEDGSADKTGKVKAEKQTVTFVYAPKPGGSVIAKYIDKNGKELQDMNVVQAKGTQVGTPYQSNKPEMIEVNGRKYKLVEIKGEETGKVIEGEIEVIYIYEDISEPVAPNTGFNKFIDNTKFIILAIMVLAISTLAIRKKAYIKF